MERCIHECHACAIVFTCDRRCIPTLSASLRSLFLYEIDLANLEEQDRAEVFINELSTPNDVDIQSVARHTSVSRTLYIRESLKRVHEPSGQMGDP